MNNASKKLLAIVGVAAVCVTVYSMLKKEEPAALNAPAVEADAVKPKSVSTPSPKEYAQQRKQRIAEEGNHFGSDTQFHEPDGSIL